MSKTNNYISLFSNYLIINFYMFKILKFLFEIFDIFFKYNIIKKNTTFKKKFKFET
jgi:hypothetical protein